tara:strand:- start:228 stop:689 length:462 start_codon:yes stop_codon:yes gene_type:complete
VNGSSKIKSNNTMLSNNVLHSNNDSIVGTTTNMSSTVGKIANKKQRNSISKQNKQNLKNAKINNKRKSRNTSGDSQSSIDSNDSAASSLMEENVSDGKATPNFRMNVHTKINSLILGIDDWTDTLESNLSSTDENIMKSTLKSMRTRVCQIVE